MTRITNLFFFFALGCEPVVKDTTCLNDTASDGCVEEDTGQEGNFEKPEFFDPSDTDGDGYTVEEGDCDDTNPQTTPRAGEINENGIDDNCNGLVDQLHVQLTWNPEEGVALLFQMLEVDEQAMLILVAQTYEDGRTTTGYEYYDFASTLTVSTNRTEFEEMPLEDITFGFESPSVLSETGTKCIFWGPLAEHAIQAHDAEDYCAIVDDPTSVEDWG